MNQSEYNEFLNIFFEDHFLILVVLSAAWFLISRQSLRQRLKELLFLNSLPLGTNKINDRFLYYDIKRFSWVPLLVVILNFNLLPVSSFNFVLRVSLMTFVIYLFFTSIGYNLNLFFSQRRRKHYSLYFPRGSSAFVYLIIVTGFPVFYLYLILSPGLILQTNYFFILFTFIALIFLLRRLSQRLFFNWMDQGLYLQKDKLSKSGSIKSRFDFGSLTRRFPRINPLLIKNLTGLKAQTVNSSIILTTIYILIAYILSRNNSLMENVEQVIYIFAIIYLIQSAYRVIYLLAENNESQLILYTLPIKTGNVYFSLFLPAFIWMLLVVVIFTMLLLISGNPGQSSITFFIRNTSIAFVSLHLAVCLAILSFPDIQKAGNNYMMVIFILLFLTAVLFKYYIIVLIAACLIVLIALSKKNFFRVI